MVEATNAARIRFTRGDMGRRCRCAAAVRAEEDFAAAFVGDVFEEDDLPEEGCAGVFAAEDFAAGLAVSEAAGVA